jgi:hypothetical protein
MFDGKPIRLIGMSGSLRTGSYSNAVLATLRETFAGRADLVLRPRADPALQPGFRGRQAILAGASALQAKTFVGRRSLPLRSEGGTFHSAARSGAVCSATAGGFGIASCLSVSRND